MSERNVFEGCNVLIFFFLFLFLLLMLRVREGNVCSTFVYYYFDSTCFEDKSTSSKERNLADVPQSCCRQFYLNVLRDRCKKCDFRLITKREMYEMRWRELLYAFYKIDLKSMSYIAMAARTFLKGV